MWGEVDVNGERVIKAFSSDALELLSAHLPTGISLFQLIELNFLVLLCLTVLFVIVFGLILGLQLIHNDLRASMTNGYLTSKIICLVETLLEYRFC